MTVVIVIVWHDYSESYWLYYIVHNYDYNYDYNYCSMESIIVIIIDL